MYLINNHKQGYLNKAPTTEDALSSIKSMKKRFFRLHGNSLEYLESPNDVRPKGSFTITASCFFLEPTDDVSFVFYCGARKLKAIAESKQDRDDWMEKISMAIRPGSNGIVYSTAPSASASAATSAARPASSSLTSSPGRKKSLTLGEVIDRKISSKVLGSLIPSFIRSSSAEGKNSAASGSPSAQMNRESKKFGINPDEIYVRMCGYLLKKGGFDGRIANFKKRFFVLRKNLMYFKTEEDWHIYHQIETGEEDSDDENNQQQEKKEKKLPWSTTLNLDMFTCQKYGKTQGKNFDFVLNCVNKELLLRASSEEERTLWMTAINEPLTHDIKRKFIDCLYDKDHEKNRLVGVMEDNAVKVSESNEVATEHGASADGNTAYGRETIATSLASASYYQRQESHSSFA